MKLLYLACLLPLAGCGDDDCCKVDPDASTGGDGSNSDGRTEVARVPVTVNRDIDILFVIDDSPSMLDKQTNLKNNFPNFINVLNTVEGGLPNVHLGVVSTDLGTKGADDASAGPGIGSGPGSCSGNGKAGNLQTNGSTLVVGSFISDTKNTDGTRTTNYSGSLASAFSAIASLGAAGCGFEQPIEAAKRALNNNPANAGFLRPTAGLAIVMLTDEDDCSISHSTLLSSDTATLGPLQSFRCTRFGVTCDNGGANSDAMNVMGSKTACHSNEQSAYLKDIGSYATFFQGLKANPNAIVMAAIAAPPTPFDVELRAPPGGGTMIPALAHSCTYQGAAGPEVGDPAVRVVEFLNHFPRHTFGTVCQADLSGPLIQTAQVLNGLVGSPCVYETLAMPLDCVVTEEIGASKTTLPQCNNGSSSTNKPCWELLEDPASCAGGSHLKLTIERSQAPDPSAVVVMRCKV
ncbi:MAG TPA: hypothetical protein VFV99_27945 [Kofleriaceae bacterium]|nr:hypothetical protein [Kofleriaceae bacterium]